jgi:hypothetical protein
MLIANYKVHIFPISNRDKKNERRKRKKMKKVNNFFLSYHSKIMKNINDYKKKIFFLKILGLKMILLILVIFVYS